MGLHIGILGVEDLFQTLYGQLLGLIHHLAAAVIAVAGIALGIFVGQTGAHGFHHLVGHEVFRGYQLYALFLALMLAVDDVENLIVALHNN